LQIGRIVFGSQIQSSRFTITAATTIAFVADDYRKVATVMIGFEFPIEKLMTSHNAFSTKTEKRLRIMIGDLLVLSCANRARLLQIAQSFDLGGLIIVTVVGTNRKIILS
jgi:hypothetical protein